jgi:hypothetical protein
VQPILNIRDVPGRHQVDNLAMAEGGPFFKPLNYPLTSFALHWYQNHVFSKKPFHQWTGKNTRVQPILNIRDVPGRHQVDNLAMAEGGPHAGVAHASFSYSVKSSPLLSSSNP